MIQLLARRYNWHVAYILSIVFSLNLLLPGVVFAGANNNGRWLPTSGKLLFIAKKGLCDLNIPASIRSGIARSDNSKIKEAFGTPDIDGPSQPEMSSFKAAGTNDMVNLFTGDFSYNIPLLDVGGYPVNIFYSGEMGMEQEASWVGLGWNINPGNINRNVRGIPDDFNGEEQVIQEQNMKKNITWGVVMGSDLELVGIKQWNKFFKGNVGVSLGYSLNNYLGPAIEIGLKGSTSFRVGAKGISEKGPIGVTAGLSVGMNSRSGMTLTPNLSLSSRFSAFGLNLSQGVGLSTSYNSRSGIKSLHLSGQTSVNYTIVKESQKKDGSIELKERSGAMSGTILSSSISFNKPSYTPSIRAVITNASGAGRFQFGGAMFGVYPSFELEGYGQISEIAPADRLLKKPMVGYLYAEKANNNSSAIMDFTRFNDQEVTPTTSIISVPQYSYDVFSIQGEGTGGTFRAYRNDNGYMRDNLTVSKDKSWSAGVDVGVPGHVGANFNTIKTPNTIGEWDNGNNLKANLGFTGPSGTWENVYFRNPGENSVLHPNQYSAIGGTDLVRYKLGGSGESPTVEPKLLRYSPDGRVVEEIDAQPTLGITEREKRTQITSFLTAEEASVIGLNHEILSFDPDTFLELYNGTYRLKVKEQIERISEFRKPNHISQINITEADGSRYIYDVPVYNLEQKDFSFTVADNCSECDLVDFVPQETTVSSPHMNSGVGGKDGFVQNTTTPPYAHSYLLGALLTPDYVDVNGDGITEDDLGGAVKFNYSKVGVHRWRTPQIRNDVKANSNPGNLSETRDDKAIISYGARESWYLQSIESKTMIAFFTLEDRADGKGLTGDNPFSAVDYNDHSTKRLKQIDLYSKADLRKNGLSVAKPVKTVHFSYNYSLCDGTPDNQSGGKLTLEKIWFTYNKQRQNSPDKDQYVFSYTRNATQVTGENPSYALNATDRWGSYKPVSDNPMSMPNRDYPYTVQQKEIADRNANAWSLKKILLPSGGQIEVEYESDDYAFVQDKRAAIMTGLIGFSDNPSDPTSNLYTVKWNSTNDNNYVFIRVPDACSSRQEVFEKYLRGLSQLLVKMKVNMEKGPEFLTSYATIEDYGVYDNGAEPGIWVKMKTIEDRGKSYSPLAMTALEYMRERLPAQAFQAYDVTEGSALEQLEQMFKGLAEGIGSTFSRIPEYLRERHKAQSVDLSQSFVRVNDPDGFKFGGGQRVKRVILRDNWDRMTGQYGAMYGQQYDYTTTESFNGLERRVSSGVASYEPSIGGEENPFQSIIQIANQVPLGPTSYGAIEMPVMDAFFPAALVGYSKVTVTSIGKHQNPDTLNKKTRSGVGKQVTEFYTAKDFPVFYDYTALEPSSDKQAHSDPLPNFFWTEAFDGRAISQGFIVATNDMHGKMKSQSSYAENDLSTRINYTENFYRNTGVKGMDDRFDFIYKDLGGEIRQGNMGIDIELMTDTREFRLVSRSDEVQGQVDWMLPPPFPLWLPFIWYVGSKGENIYRAVTTTKVVSYHSVIDSVLVIDKGSQVSTKNLVFDSETGQVIVNRTNNEFDQPIYTISLPAYWAYSGMGPAYRNINAVYSGVNFLNGQITSNNVPLMTFESGDELLIVNPGSTAGCDPGMLSGESKQLVWAFNRNKNVSSLTDMTPDFIFIDKDGKPYSRTGVTFRIVRSGKRNLLGQSLASVTLMKNPIDGVSHKLVFNSDSKVVNATAAMYKEKWQSDNDAFKRFYLSEGCGYSNEVPDCNGYLEKSINPYRKGLLGNYYAYRSMVFYGPRAETDPTAATDIARNGFIQSFTPYWTFNSSANLVPTTDDRWVWNNEATRYNTKGLATETKDALGIYSSAQYGFRQTVPVAIASNARYGEMFSEGFEDYDFHTELGVESESCPNAKYVLFESGRPGRIVNTDALPFRAHTGKYVLQVDNGTFPSYSKSVAVSSPAATDFTMDMLPGGTEALSDIGSNVAVTIAQPQTLNISPASPTFSGMGLQYYVYTNGHALTTQGNQTVKSAQYQVETSHYVKLETAGNFTFYLRARRVNSDPFDPADPANALTLTIKTKNGAVVGTASVSSIGDPQGQGTYYNIQLCSGIYRIEYTMGSIFQRMCPAGDNSCLNIEQGHDEFTANCFDFTGPRYKSLTTQGNCTFTRPVAGDENMLNPSFTIPAGKKMVFSGWVRESCGDPQGGTPCNVSGYTNNQVVIGFDGEQGGQVTLLPTGPIIEGWQRYEGYFDVPQTATKMTMTLTNNSTSPIYFDDIRIHPFNSNVQSYIYDPVTMRLVAQLDANNYATFYEYDEEGTPVRTKAETKQGVKTITESRSAKQKKIQNF